MPRKKLYKVDENKTQNGDTTNLQLQFKKLDELMVRIQKFLDSVKNENQ
jgi:hypothetical protein